MQPRPTANHTLRSTEELKIIIFWSPIHWPTSLNFRDRISSGTKQSNFVQLTVNLNHIGIKFAWEYLTMRINLLLLLYVYYLFVNIQFKFVHVWFGCVGVWFCYHAHSYICKNHLSMRRPHQVKSWFSDKLNIQIGGAMAYFSQDFELSTLEIKSTTL
jgi:hypothetical protein